MVVVVVVMMVLTVVSSKVCEVPVEQHDDVRQKKLAFEEESGPKGTETGRQAARGQCEGCRGNFGKGKRGFLGLFFFFFFLVPFCLDPVF